MSYCYFELFEQAVWEELRRKRVCVPKSLCDDVSESIWAAYHEGDGGDCPDIDGCVEVISDMVDGLYAKADQMLDVLKDGGDW